MSKTSKILDVPSSDAIHSPITVNSKIAPNRCLYLNIGGHIKISNSFHINSFNSSSNSS